MEIRSIPGTDRHTAEASLTVPGRFGFLHTSALALATLSAVSCTADAPQALTGAAAQPVLSSLPGNLNLILNAKRAVTIGALASVSGDVGSSGDTGSVLFDVSSTQGFGGNVVASAIEVRVGAQAGHVLGNDITVDGFVASQALGLDPATMPAVPAATAAVPGTTSISVTANGAKQLCAGQYGNVSLGSNATLNLNGGVYHMTKLTLADGARLQPSEPVVILVGGAVLTGTGAFIGPFPTLVNPMSAGDIRLEVGGAVTIGASSEVHAHILAPNGKLSTGKNARLFGAAWASTISIGAQGVVQGEGVFSPHASEVPPACNDNNACTVDQCVGGGTASGFCRNTARPSGTACGDDNACNGVELCDGAGQCQPGTIAAAGTSCADGDACNGDETCNGFGTCVPGAPPVVNDGNTCTDDFCDPTAGVEHVSLPDGTTCSGSGVCQAGTCSVQGFTFSQDFFEGATPFGQCDQWNVFLGQVGGGQFNSVTLSGTFNTAGLTCNDPVAATQICQSMHDGGFASVFCNGRVWNVGQCGFGTEVSADGSTCVCAFGSGNVARPCIGNSNWGGVNTTTCFGPTQNITVTCQ
jgi:hypothetical protein